ncbi:uncharacterized protein LOC128202345 [Galleria mellonella]|uniref:Uncharacterized protein LOC128202345 n=1 Tax=Galleria mellonella TaxID=7137 RepID=A0ABM3N449_GALME|nr:uncharacterized protein LOC128202345 [Galleria mellonella]
MSIKFTHSKRGLFKDQNYLYSDTTKNEYFILLSPIEGNNVNLLQVNSILRTVPGVFYIRTMGSTAFKICFRSMKQANEFLLNKDLLEKHKLQARIPNNQLESQGVIRAPTEISEEDLLNNLKSTVDIIGVKRFKKKKEDGSFHPLPTVLVTFLSTQRPDHVTYDHIWLDVREFIRPLLQCFTCYKFGHGSSSCRSKQVCSICAGAHDYRSCINKDNPKCVNCNGQHVAVSNSCPTKSMKLSQIKDKILGKTSYASVTSKSVNSVINSNTPVSINSPTQNKSPQKRALVIDIINSDIVLNTITKTVIELVKKAQTNSDTISSKLIKEILISNFST